ncbi:MAG: DUF368 domain-containing protein, partial [Flavobacteriales bacterium]|nr:DUF368 domain-containing protein [Flavobacteriales bacterium]
LGVAARGLAMGAADIVPGVSGGTIAFITGIYEELLESLSSINLHLISILRKEGLKAAWEKLNGNFLVALFTGVLVSIFSLAKAIKYLLTEHPHLLWAFFLGLVVASIIYVGKQVKSWYAGNIVGLILAAAFAFYITLLPPLGTASNLWYILLCGMIAICAMILPGISGSFILLLLGAYQTVIGAVSELNFKLLLTFASGCVVGLVSFSRLLNWMFKNARDLTVAILTGFLIGSLNKLWPWKQNVELLYTHSDGRQDFLQTNVLPETFSKLPEGGEPQILIAIVLALVGFALIFMMEQAASRS